MSSLITPLIESNRSNAALTFWVFTFTTLFLSLKKVPNFSSLENILGLLFITLLITAILSAIGFTNWIKKRISGLKFNDDDWVGKDQKLLQTPAFHHLIDKNTSSLFFGLGLVFLGIEIFIFGLELVISFFGDDYALEGMEVYIPFVIGLFIVFVGLGIFVLSLRQKERHQIEKFSWELILLSRIRKIPEGPRSKNEYKKDLLAKIKSYTKERDFFALDDDLEATFFNQIREILEIYMKNLKEISPSSIEDPDELLDYGYPYLTLDIDSMAHYESFGSDLLTRTSYDSQSLITRLKNPKIESINVFELLFAKKSDIITSVKKVEELATQIAAIDILFFRFTSFFISALNASVLPDLAPIKKGEITNIDGYLSSKTFINYSIFFSKCLLTYSGFSSKEVTPINIIIRDGNVRKQYRDISIHKDLLEKIEINAKKEFHSLLEKSGTKPYSKKPETTQQLLMKDIEFLNDIINDKYKHFFIYQNLFDEIVFFLETGASYKIFFEEIAKVRKTTMFSFKKELETLCNSLNKKMNNTPWRHHIKWDEKWIKFVEKQEKSTWQRISISFKDKISNIRAKES